MCRLIVALVFTAFLVLLSQCSPFSYFTDYHTYLVNSDPKTLAYKDSLFAFEFNPVPNGLYYNITNLSNTPATLEWDRCYFIEPSGNPSRALNIDGVREGSRTNESPTNISIIPPNASLGRFTTSALNVRAITEINSFYYFYKSFGFSSSTLNTFYDYGRYWPAYRGPVFAPADSLHKNDLALPSISSYIRNNNNMGVGFCLRVKDTVVEYKFDFKIDNIAIYKVRDTVIKDLVFYAFDTTDWAWQKAPLSIPTLILPGNGAIVDSFPVHLKWSKPIGARSFAVQVSADSAFQSIILQDSLKLLPTKFIRKLGNNRTYFWRVSAKYTGGKSDWSAPNRIVIAIKNKK